MTQNDQKWAKMAKLAETGPKRAAKCQNWPEMGQKNVRKLAGNGRKMAENGRKGPKMAKNGRKWPKNGREMAENGRKWPRMAENSQK